jgi:phage N-6-adenine-methyltransferase
MMTVQKPGRSVQDVGTPPWFLKVVSDAFGPIVLDVAASDRYHACEAYLTEADDALSLPNWYAPGGMIWCNPPYGRIAPWVEIAARCPTPVAVLVPAAVGSNWWAAHVHGKAAVFFLRPRLTFLGHDTPFPKDLALLVYGTGIGAGYRLARVTPNGIGVEGSEGALS